MFTIRSPGAAQDKAKGDVTAIGVSYDAFVDDIQVAPLPPRMHFTLFTLHSSLPRSTSDLGKCFSEKEVFSN